MMKVLLAIGLLVFAISGGIARADEWDENYELGKEALERGDWQKAIQHFQTAIESKSKPDPQATTSSLKLVEYLPYFYLAQAYLFSGNYEEALKNFKTSQRFGAINQTAQKKRLQTFLALATKLKRLQKLEKSARKPNLVDETRLQQLEKWMSAGQIKRAAELLSKLKMNFPGDSRLRVYEKWLQSVRQSVASSPPSEPSNQDELRFQKALNLYLLGQYDQALEAFHAIAASNPDFPVIQNWINKTVSEKGRLVGSDKIKETTPPPRVIETVIKTTTAPVFAIRFPSQKVSETRSDHLEIVGQVGDDQGIARIEIILNGQQLMDPQGNPVSIQPEAEQNPRKFDFSTRVPLRMGENQVVLAGYDQDENQHITQEIFTVLRKPPLYKTTAFNISVGAVLFLAVGSIFVTRAIKYRIAIVNKYNPYIAGSPIRTDEMFFGREKLIKRILNTLHNNSIMLYGPRRIGKTSLQHQLKRCLEELNDPEYHFIPVLIDLQGTTESRFFATLMEDILEVCLSQLNGKITLDFYEKKAHYTSRDFSRDLKRILDVLKTKTSKQLKLVLLIDEVDELNKYSDQTNQKLRSVFMKTFAENLVAVMSGAYIRKTWESEGSPWYNFFEEIELPPLERPEAEALIRTPVKGIFSYEDEAVEKIIKYSECRPYTIQRFCINVINRIIEQKRRRVTAQDVEAVKKVVFQPSQLISNS